MRVGEKRRREKEKKEKQYLKKYSFLILTSSLALILISLFIGCQKTQQADPAFPAKSNSHINQNQKNFTELSQQLELLKSKIEKEDKEIKKEMRAQSKTFFTNQAIVSLKKEMETAEKIEKNKQQAEKLQKLVNCQFNFDFNECRDERGEGKNRCVIEDYIGPCGFLKNLRKDHFITLSKEAQATEIKNFVNKLDTLKKEAQQKSTSGKALLVGMNFEHAVLPGIDLSNLVLYGAIFKKAVLSGAKLNHSILTSTDFSHALMDGVEAKNTDLVGANLSNAILTQSDLSNSILSGVLANQADFGSAKLVKILFHDLSKESHKFLKKQNGVGSYNASFKNANFYLADLSKVLFTNINLEEADFTDSVLEESLFYEKTNLKYSIFYGANLCDARFYEDTDRAGGFMNSSTGAFVRDIHTFFRVMFPNEKEVTQGRFIEASRKIWGILPQENSTGQNCETRSPKHQLSHPVDISLKSIYTKEEMERILHGYKFIFDISKYGTKQIAYLIKIGRSRFYYGLDTRNNQYTFLYDAGPSSNPYHIADTFYYDKLLQGQQIQNTAVLDLAISIVPFASTVDKASTNGLTLDTAVSAAIDTADTAATIATAGFAKYGSVTFKAANAATKTAAAARNLEKTVRVLQGARVILHGGYATYELANGAHGLLSADSTEQAVEGAQQIARGIFRFAGMSQNSRAQFVSEYAPHALSIENASRTIYQTQNNLPRRNIPASSH